MALRQKYAVEAMSFANEVGEGAQTAHDVYEVNFGPRLDAKGGELTLLCDVCGVPFPESKTVLFRGRVYGVPCGDNADIAGILRQERAKAFQPARRRPESEATMAVE